MQKQFRRNIELYLCTCGLLLFCNYSQKKVKKKYWEKKLQCEKTVLKSCQAKKNIICKKSCKEKHYLSKKLYRKTIFTQKLFCKTLFTEKVVKKNLICRKSCWEKKTIYTKSCRKKNIICPKSCTVKHYLQKKLFCKTLFTEKVAKKNIIYPKSCAFACAGEWNNCSAFPENAKQVPRPSHSTIDFFYYFMITLLLFGKMRYQIGGPFKRPSSLEHQHGTEGLKVWD